MRSDFYEFIKALKESNFSLGDYVDFKKVSANVESISIKLNQLNYLIGQADMSAAVKNLWEENPKVFSVLDILIAVRKKDKKIVIDENGRSHEISTYFTTPEQVVIFLNQTGLTEIFQSKKIKNLVDYVFGVEVGLDTNARKNRSGKIMESLIARIFEHNGITFDEQVSYKEFPEIVKVLGVDNKRFDFVVRTDYKTFLIEVNFYTSGGSKLNEVARSYTELSQKINGVPGFEFVWITDGKGWESAQSKLEEAFVHIRNIYNISNIDKLIDQMR